ncbi:MAG: TlpA family protein disulfide reductase [Lentisphaerae bacterium]|jgi:thiol-disulfide isomerase/thioredoxin|nr:TlpA family protein disulfide reductase [Lentisphaerota bacterium]
MKISTKILAILGVLSTVFTAGAAKIGDVAPEMKISKWVQGKAFEVKEGQVTVVEFWATWCPPCRTSIPHLNDLYNKYKDKGVVMVGVSSESEKTVKKFVKNMGKKMEYPVAIGSAKTTMGYMDAFKARGIPHAFVIGHDGKFAWHGHPMSGLDKVIEAEVKKLEDFKKANPEKFAEVKKTKETDTNTKE